MTEAPTKTGRSDDDRFEGKDPSHIPSSDLAWPFPLPDPRLPGRKPGRGAGDGRKGDDKPPTYAPYIEIDDQDASTPPGVFYLSPDIWVVSSAGMNLPKQGEDNQIYVRVHNRGLMDAGSVTVRFYVNNPSGAITGQGPMPIGGDPVAATLTGVYVPAGSDVVVACPVPWRPDPGTHQCLLAKAWCQGLDPATAPFEPPLDPFGSRYAAQRNVTVTMVQAAKAFALTIEVGNITGLKLPLEVLVHEIPFDLVVNRIRRMQIKVEGGLSQPWRAPTIDARLAEERWFQKEGPATFGRMLVAAETVDRAAAREPAKAVIRLTADLAPYERRRVVLEGRIPDGARRGEAFAYDVTQLLGGVVTGGYSGLFIVGG